ncbi:MAG TPA: retron St85 family effector protein [Terracidiphilus sp.]|jgi:hypothetical protein
MGATNKPLTHPGAQRIRAELIRGLSENFYIHRLRRIVFVCGGEIDPAKANLRSDFVIWAQKNIESDALILLSETAYRAATEIGKSFINIAIFEELLASISDCVLIFPESAGSYSEVGIFAVTDSIRNKTLIANDSSHEKNDSFLNLGPIHAINTVSLFTPSVDFDSSRGADPSFAERIWKRVKDRTKKFEVSRRPDIIHFVDMSPVDRIAIVSWILNIAGISKFGDLLDIVRAVYKKHARDSKKLKETLGLLLAIEQISMPANELYRTKSRPDFQLSVSIDEAKLMAQFRIFWIKEFPRLWSC